MKSEDLSVPIIDRACGDKKIGANNVGAACPQLISKPLVVFRSRACFGRASMDAGDGGGGELAMGRQAND
jgi:hypothetical protein